MPLIQDSEFEDVSTVGTVFKFVREGLRKEAREAGARFFGRWSLTAVSRRARINAAHLSNVEHDRGTVKRVTRSLQKVAHEYGIADDVLETFSQSKMPDGSDVTEAKLQQYAAQHIKEMIAEKGEAWLLGEVIVRGDQNVTPEQLATILEDARKNNPEAAKLVLERLQEIARPRMRRRS